MRSGDDNPNRWGQGLSQGLSNALDRGPGNRMQPDPAEYQAWASSQAQYGQFSARPANDRDLAMLQAIAGKQREIEPRIASPAPAKGWLGMSAAVVAGLASGAALMRLAATFEVRRRPKNASRSD